MHLFLSLIFVIVLFFARYRIHFLSIENFIEALQPKENVLV